MLFPKNRVRFTTSYQGKTDAQGWIVLDLAGVDLDGVNKLYLSMADLTALQKAGDVASDRLKQARTLLGGGDDDS
ncbi:MAG TPA: hypothetical protein VFB21_10700 [Chthonomonadaceae bacterium]|nr:hypothetical protein [Chthonomonadaceae bacterium]